MVATNTSFSGTKFQAILSRISQPMLVIADEAHNLGERARGYGSPILDAQTVTKALACDDERYRPFHDLAQALRDWLASLASFYDDREVALPLEDLDLRGLRALAEHADALALDYSLAAASFPFFARDEDPWIAMVRELLRFRAVVDRAACQTRLFDLLAGYGTDLRDRLCFTETITPGDLASRYRAPGGAIYGTSSNGRRAAFRRPANAFRCSIRPVLRLLPQMRREALPGRSFFRCR